MICSNCGTENRAGRKFCIQCGTVLSATCASCRSPLEPEARFCGECGTPVEGAPAGRTTDGGISTAAAGRALRGAARPAPPVAERRLVSVLFADLVGFTPFAEERDAEDVRETLTRYFELAQTVITRYGGTIEKFIGDAVMAVWGAPTAREKDAELAVRAALELVDAVRTLGPGIEARAGIVTGEAAVTLGATNQGMVAGDIVNTASRLQSVAPPGTVLVGESTHRAANRTIAFEPVGVQTLKGKASPVAAFRALRVVGEVAGAARSEAFEAPFVGRDEELRLLKDLFHATERDRRTRLVSIIGPGGIGKTRIAGEFAKYADGLIETVYWHRGRSPSYGEGLTFWALGEMVRGRAELRETDDEPTTRAKVAATVGAWVPDEDERRWIEPALLTLLGIGGSPIASEELFAAWRTFFERIAGQGSVVLVFEDLQWADAGLLDFIDHVLEWGRSVPLYVVTLARPELLDRRPDWGAGKRNFTSLHLEPLPEAAMRLLIAGLVPGLPESAVRAIVERADGVPLYAVETVRMLVTDGRLKAVDGVFQPVGDLAQLAVPESLTELIAARLDGLEAADRSLLQDAAVVGQSFPLAALSAVSGFSDADLEPRLRALVRRELLTLQADPRSPERGQYAFVQALIREVAYNTLARKERKTRHLAAARFFEALGTEELAGALAGQYLAAYRNAAEGPEADALATQARLALRAAAERAAALGSHAQAVALLDEALTVTTDPSEEADLLERAGASASSAGHHDAAEWHLRRAIELRRAGGDRIGVARTTGALGRALLTARNGDIALEILEAANAEFADLSDEPVMAALGGQLARAYFLTGNARRAIEVAERVLEVAEHADLIPVVADTLVTKGSSLETTGRSAEGMALLRAGQALAETHGLADVLLRALGNLGSAESARDPRRALEIGREGLAVMRRLGTRFGMSNVFYNAAFAAMRVGEWDWAIRELEATLAEDLETSDRAEILELDLAFRAYRGDPTGEMAEELERLLGDATDPYRIATLHLARADAAFAAGRFRDARAAWRQAFEIVRYDIELTWMARAALWDGDADAAREDLLELDRGGAHGPALEADRTSIRAGLAALTGRAGDALGEYRDAMRAWRDLGLAWDEALCAIGMATLLDPAEPEVLAAAESGREILARLGARPFLDRLEAAMSRVPAAAPLGRAAQEIASSSPTRS